MAKLSKKPNKDWNKEFELLKRDILGPDYELSLAFISKEESQKINKKYRKKDRSTNVLSFPFSKNKGEILLTKEVIKKEAREKKFDKNYSDLLQFLVIHGMLHLKGMRHGSIMEKAEKFYCEKYQERQERKENRKNHAKHFNRNRRGILHDPGRGGRILQRRKKS